MKRGGGELYKHIWHSPLGSVNKDLMGPKVTEKIENYFINIRSLPQLFVFFLVGSHFLCRV